MEETDRELTAYFISNCEEVQKRQYSILLSPQLAIHAVFSCIIRFSPFQQSLHYKRGGDAVAVHLISDLKP